MKLSMLNGKKPQQIPEILSMLAFHNLCNIHARVGSRNFGKGGPGRGGGVVSPNANAEGAETMKRFSFAPKVRNK